QLGLSILGACRGQSVGLTLHVVEDHVVGRNLQPRCEELEAEVRLRRLLLADGAEGNLLADDPVLIDRSGSVEERLQGVGEELHVVPHLNLTSRPRLPRMASAVVLVRAMRAPAASRSKHHAWTAVQS